MSREKPILFDAYGTLFDLSQALKPAVQLLGDKSGAVLSRWRTLQLEYAWLSALAGRYVDFEIATRNAFIDALAECEISDVSLADELIAGFKQVSAYPDAKDTLEQLKGKGYTTAILSNGSPDILATATTHAGLDFHLDAVLSVDAVKTYKPARAAYSLGTSHYGVEASEVYFVSSNWWDVDGARAFGYNVMWIDRGAYIWPPSLERPKVIVKALSELSGIL